MNSNFTVSLQQGNDQAVSICQVQSNVRRVFSGSQLFLMQGGPGHAPWSPFLNFMEMSLKLSIFQDFWGEAREEPPQNEPLSLKNWECVCSRPPEWGLDMYPRKNRTRLLAKKCYVLFDLSRNNLLIEESLFSTLF